MTNSQFFRSVNLSPQQRTILGHLASGKTISDMESMTVYNGSSRLSDVILKLRRKGFNITTDVRKDEAGAKYSRYSFAG
jgi:hypothetical protein